MIASIDDISINYELSGTGKTLALIHGMGDDLSLWANQVPGFSKKYQVLTFDVRGHGQSDKPRAGYSLQSYADDLYSLLKLLKIERAFLLGFSMGAVIAMKFSLDHPEMVKALIIVSSSSHVSPKATAGFEKLADTAEVYGMEALLGTPGGSLFIQNRFLPAFAEKNPDFVAKFKQRWLLNDPKGFAGAARSMSSYNLTPELGKITCPTLILVGAEDKAVGVGGAVIINRNIRGSQLKIISECGHDIAREKAEELNAAVLEFLAQVH